MALWAHLFCQKSAKVGFSALAATARLRKPACPGRLDVLPSRFGAHHALCRRTSALRMSAWDELEERAMSRDGLFHVREARELGINDQALYKSPRVERVEDLSGVHRFVNMKSGRWYLYTAGFIWSRGEGVISHGSGLEVWGLSDWEPHRVEMTLPLRWKTRIISRRVLAFFADLPENDVQWYEGFRVTTARRSVDDFIAWGVRPDLARQAVDQATSRSRPGGPLFHRRQLKNRHLLVG